MPVTDNGLTLPALPDAPTYGNVMQTLRAPLPSLNAQLPAIGQMLGPNSQYVQSSLSQMQAGTNRQLSDLTGMFGKRGLTGSSIEASGLGQAAGAGIASQNQFLGGLAQDQSKMMADLMFRAQQGDQQAYSQMLMNLAQAMGQKLTSDQDLMLFEKQLAANIAQAKKNSNSGLWGAIGGGVGAIAGAAGLPGGPAVWSGIGQGVGGALGGR